MIKKISPLLALLLATAGFAAGCGGDDDKGDSSSTSATPAATATAEETTTAEGTSSDDSSSSDIADDPRVKQAIQQCKDSIDSNPSVKDDIKDDLKGICDKAATGNAEDLKKASQEVCEKIVESSVPEGDIRDQALESCKTAGG